MFDATTSLPASLSRRAFLRGSSTTAFFTILASQPLSPLLLGARARALEDTLGLWPPHLLAAMELAAYVPPLFHFSPGRLSMSPDRTYTLVSFGNSNSLDTWQGIRHHSTAQAFARRMNRTGRGRWVVRKNYAHPGDTELEVDAQVTNSRTVRELRGVKNLAVFVDACGDDFKHNLATPAEVSSLRRFLSTISSGNAFGLERGDPSPLELTARLAEEGQAAIALGREAARVAGAVASDIAAMSENSYRLLADINRLHHPAVIFWTNASNYGYVRYFALGEQTSQHFPIDGPIERRFATNVAAAINNQEYLGIKKFLSRAGSDAPGFVYIDAFHHVSAAELADGPHYNDAGVELLAGLAADQLV